jgi:hypothetical protein
VRIPSWLEADPALHSEAVYIEADRFFHQKILLAIGRRTTHSDPRIMALKRHSICAKVVPTAKHNITADIIPAKDIHLR